MPEQSFSLIGAGRMGQTHLQAAVNLNLEIRGVFDLNQNTLASISSTLIQESTSLTSNLEEFLHLEPATLLTIATTAPSHCQLIKSAIEAGFKKIVCEKPLAVSIRELEEIENLCIKNKVVLSVNHQMRFMEQYSVIKKLQTKFDLGSLVTMTVNGANFGLGMNGTHYMEAFHWLTQSEFTTVSGSVRKQKNPNVRGKQFYDYAGFVVIQGNARAVLFIDFQEEASHQIVVVYNFEKGKIIINELQGKLTIDCRETKDLHEPTFRYGLTNNHHELTIKPAELLKSTSRLYDEVLRGGDYPDYSDGARTVRSAIAAIHSSELGGFPISPFDVRLSQIVDLTWP
jgi:predicted dehydrogenase